MVKLPKVLDASVGSRCVYMHIGQGKTGSSYLQSSLAISSSKLQDFNLYYPSEGRQHNRAISGHVNVGNLPPTKGLGRHSPGSFLSALEAAALQHNGSLVFSNEGLFSSIVNHDLWSEIKAQAKVHKIHMFVLIRDPLDHALSAYQQGIKGGLTKTIGQFLENYCMPVQTRKLIELVDGSEIQLTIKNYSRHKSNLLAIAEDWLRLPPETLVVPPHEKVNRSLTRAESAFQIAFNRHVGARARLFVSDALANELPNIEAEQIFVEPEALEKFLERMTGLINDVNKFLPDGEGYRIETLDEAMTRLPTLEEVNQLSITQSQIEVLARNVARFIKPEYKIKGNKK